MSILTALAATLGSPSILLALVLSAVSLLELERRWTRARRFAGMPAGAPALVLDGLVILATLLAVIGGVLMLIRAIVSALQYTFAQINGLTLPINGTIAGLVAGFTIALLILVVLIRRMTVRTPSSRPSAHAGDVQTHLLALKGSALPSAAPLLALPEAAPSGNLEEEPPLVMLRTRRPTTHPVSAPEQPRTPETVTAQPGPDRRRLPWSVVIVIALLATGVAGVAYRDAVLTMASSVVEQMMEFSAPASSTADTPMNPTSPPMTATIAPPPAPQILQVAVERLNLRAGPGTSYPVVKTLKRGDDVESLGETAGSGEDVWVRVRAGTQEGWVFRAFLQEPTSPSP